MKRDVCQLHLEFPTQTRRNQEKTETAIFTCDPGEYIKNYKHVQTDGLGPTSFKIQEISAGAKFVSQSDLSAEYSEAINLAAELGYKGDKLAELKADLETKYSQYRNYANEIAASHETIEHTATIQGAGIGNGRTIYGGYIEAEIERAPNELLDRNNLRSAFRSVIDTFVANNEVQPSGDNGQFTEKHLAVSNIIQTGETGTFFVNKFNQLIRAYWNGGHKAEIIAQNVAVKKGTLKYSEAHKAIFALTDGEHTDVLVVRYVEGKWTSGILDAWGANIIPESFELKRGEFGITGVNTNGNLVGTWHDNEHGTELPGGDRLSFAIIHEVGGIV